MVRDHWTPPPLSVQWKKKGGKGKKGKGAIAMRYNKGRK